MTAVLVELGLAVLRVRAPVCTALLTGRSGLFAIPGVKRRTRRGTNQTRIACCINKTSPIEPRPLPPLSPAGRTRTNANDTHVTAGGAHIHRPGRAKSRPAGNALTSAELTDAQRRTSAGSLTKASPSTPYIFHTGIETFSLISISGVADPLQKAPVSASPD